MIEHARNEGPRWWLLAILTVLAAAAGVGIGVAVAGLPDDADDDATTVDGSGTASTEAPDITTSTDTAATDATTATSGSASDTTAPDTTAPDTTDVGSTATTDVATTDPATTEPDPSTTVSAPVGTDDTTLPPRDQLVVVVANGSGVAGAAAFNADLLRLSGYTQVSIANGTVPADQTVVYHGDDLRPAAVRLVDDLDLGDVFVIPLADAPPTDPPAVPPGGDAQILVYLGGS